MSNFFSPTAGRMAAAAALKTPPTIETFGVVGAGLMASQLGLLFADKLRIPVLLSDLSSERISAAMHRIHAHLDTQERRGRIQKGEAAEIAGLIRGTTDLSGFRNCDAVIEAVFEDHAVKRSVFKQLEEYVAPDALLLTNTSSLSVTGMARGLKQPERVLGFHFFNPVAVLPLVELVRTAFSSDAAFTSACNLAQDLGKTAIPVADAPGFVVNRLLTRLFSEILAEIDKGGDPVAVDRSLESWGLPMTPLQLIGYIGPTVQRHISETLHRAYPDRFARSASLGAVAAAGLHGFFDEDGKVLPAALIPPPEPHEVDQNRIQLRLRGALAQEAQLILDGGVVASWDDIDRCMILGANFPPGGLTRLLRI
ncbi:3-hydroxyacyl-CoA dehydrogenase family protein [Arthrobacter bambusae]|uniref:3-hydroxyacyl-CoA dehydrogenase family protein n=1 Tax=Arthrobacter bambusae TaxID=1338426 RepID=UPI0027814590|nr:3-hydroxyacyl-CoA dehydrogenase family protein [Arthrobacter bambusae]MDQ0029931.1 3-hydroxyacyl-CoA dehydrogenase [Arthrobacter bambusae]MDQ0097551.1 3-hydroxyacyl-CoA dehydrogenase [Arthrobacter bambusae]